jgi:hypothetical protein
MHTHDTPEVFGNPFNDLIFKRLFGDEHNTDILMDFLNSVLPEYRTVKSLKILKSEMVSETKIQKVSILDLSCEGENGEKFILEVQNVSLPFFFDRTIFYAS